MSAQSWMGLTVVAVCVALIVIYSVALIRHHTRPRKRSVSRLDEDTMGPFERGVSMGVDAGVRSGIEILQPVIDLAESRRLMILGSREMHVKVPVELSGGRLCGHRMQAMIGEERILIQYEGRLLAYDWSARSCAGGKRWSYVFSEEYLIQQPKKP